MIVALYARVSTADQDEQLQLPRLRDYSKRMGFQVYQEYTDEPAGKNANRPGWLALLSDAKAHRFDAILVVKLDRIMRSLVDLLQTLEDFQKRGISIITLDQGMIDPSSANSRLQIQMLAMVAEWQRCIISERTSEALQQKKRQGVKLGRQARKIPVHKAALLRASGATWVQIGMELDIPATTLVGHKKEILAEMEKL